MTDDSIILFLVVRKSLNMGTAQTAQQCADAVQYILMKYFKMQVLSVKLHNEVAESIKLTTQWLANHSNKCIFCANDEDWEKLKHQFTIGKDIFLVKDMLNQIESETVLVGWPIRYNCLPDSIKSLEPLA